MSSLTYKFAPSLMCMDLRKFTNQISFLGEHAYMLHADIMDGHFVNNLTLSPFILEQVRYITEAHIDAHLMVDNPSLFVDSMCKAGADMITLHIETINGSVFRMAHKLKQSQIDFGIVLNPATDITSLEYCLPLFKKITVMTVDPGFAGQPFIPEMLKKIERLREKKTALGLDYLIEVDGSCNVKTFGDLAAAGAEVFVVGSSGLFSLHPDIEQAWELMMNNFYDAIGG
ncbi:MAG: ribulose-phosphate 3-epimerase [Candidatus Thiodiazotropha sp. (ex Rostrolucina anterorostrata)]|nr:ribulose-phosphate 3-epimerase [Candidatus Thiodiazotropha sp. (ex Rostrolucina anterorostrata)]